MVLDQSALEKLLCERLCHEVRVEQRPDDSLMLKTHFQFSDGDSYPFYLSELPSGGMTLSDNGHTLMHMSYEHDIDTYLDGPRRVILDRIVQEAGLSYEDGAFSLNTSPERLSESIFEFGQALTRVYDMTLLSRSNVGSTFYADLEAHLYESFDDETIVPGFLPDVPNAASYPVDYKINTSGPKPLFLFGVPNQDKARLVTIILGHFHRHELKFESITVFRDQQEIPRGDLARLSDVGSDMISSLDSKEDLDRKIREKAA